MVEQFINGDNGRLDSSRNEFYYWINDPSHHNSWVDMKDGHAQHPRSTLILRPSPSYLIHKREQDYELRSATGAVNILVKNISSMTKNRKYRN